MAVWLDLRVPRSNLPGPIGDISSRRGGEGESQILRSIAGRIILSVGQKNPDLCVLFVDDLALSQVEQLKLVGYLRRTFNSPLDIKVLQKADAIDFCKKVAAASVRQNIVLLGLGSESKPETWPLPDFGRFCSNTTMYQKWPPTGDDSRDFRQWLLSSAQGHLSREGRHAVRSEFEFGWGAVAGSIRRSGSLSVTTHHLKQSDSGGFYLEGWLKDSIDEFIRVDRPGSLRGPVLCSFPTAAMAAWVLSQANSQENYDRKISMTEALQGWAPTLTLMRFLIDECSPRKLLIMSDLSRIDLLEFK